MARAGKDCARLETVSHVIGAQQIRAVRQRYPTQRVVRIRTVAFRSRARPPRLTTSPEGTHDGRMTPHSPAPWLPSEVVPFTASSVSGDTYTSIGARGLMRLEDDALVLEYRETVTDLSGESYDEKRGPVQELRIPLDRVRSIQARRRYFVIPVCEIEVDRLAALGSVDWADGTLLRLRVPFRKYDIARDLAATHSLAQADARLRELGEGDLTG